MINRRQFRQLVSRLWWILRPSLLSEPALTVLQNLRRDGLAISSVAELGLDQLLFKELASECFKLADSPDALQLGGPKPSDAVKKDFFYELLGHYVPPTDPTTVFARAALHVAILSIANGYFGCYCRLTDYNVWLNTLTNNPPCASQLWHRDPGDRYLLKVFTYISEVDCKSGPFVYAPQTHACGRLGSVEAPSNKEGIAARTTDDQMRALVPESEWITVTGQPGTIVFADTRGYHKGGYVQQGRRVVFMSYYNRPLSPRAGTSPFFPRPGIELSRPAAWAIC